MPRDDLIGSRHNSVNVASVQTTPLNSWLNSIVVPKKRRYASVRFGLRMCRDKSLTAKNVIATVMKLGRDMGKVSGRAVIYTASSEMRRCAIIHERPISCGRVRNATAS